MSCSDLIRNHYDLIRNHYDLIRSHYDLIRNHYDFGIPFATECQTSDLSGGEIGFFYLDASGWLWRSNYDGTHNYLMTPEGHPDYDEKHSWKNWDVVANGNRGKVEIWNVTGHVTIRPVELPEENWMFIRAHFTAGKLDDFRY